MAQSATYRPPLLRRPNAAGAANSIPRRCPFLGTPADPGTALAFPSEANHCFRARIPTPISSIHQENYCLSHQYETCPVYRQYSANEPVERAEVVPVAAIAVNQSEGSSVALGQTLASLTNHVGGIPLLGIRRDDPGPGIARLVRGQFLSFREQQFVLAARSIGVPPIQIMFRHLFPNVISSVTVAATFGMANAILQEASLSFLGLGVQAPTPSWGNMLRDAQTLSILEGMPWLWLAPGIMIALAVLSINFIGDGLRDALDPRQKQ